MKIDEIRQLNNSDLEKELMEQHKALMNLRFSKATLQLTNTNEIGNTKNGKRRAVQHGPSGFPRSSMSLTQA